MYHRLKIPLAVLCVLGRGSLPEVYFSPFSHLDFQFLLHLRESLTSYLLLDAS